MGVVKFLSEVRVSGFGAEIGVWRRCTPTPGSFACKCSEAIENAGVVIFGGDELAQVHEKERVRSLSRGIGRSERAR